MVNSRLMNSRSVAVADLDRLRSGLHGDLIPPGDPQYETVRRVWNGAIDRRPAFIVRCIDADDVMRAVEFARRSNLEIAVRGGGHSTAGFSTTEGGAVIDLSPMKAVMVNPQDKTAHIDPGVMLGEFIQATQAYGLATNTGTVSDTGIAGLTLGGGVGWLMGKCGLTCDSVRSFDLVTADGRQVRANENENPDLYWGLRGGGGNFGIVTRFDFQLHPVGTILGGIVVHPLPRAREVLRFYRDLTRALPDELTLGCTILTPPDRSPAQPVIAIAVCYCGDLAEGERLITPLRKFGPPLVDLIHPMPYAGLFPMLDSGFKRGRNYHMKGRGVNTLSDEVIDALVNSADGLTSPFSQIIVLPVHGAASRIDAAETAFAFREEHHEILYVAGWEGEAAEKHVQWMRRGWQSLQPFASQKSYVNFMDDEGTARVRVAYGPNYERLVALKNKYDPDNVFHLNQNIKPTANPAVNRENTM